MITRLGVIGLIVSGCTAWAQSPSPTPAPENTYGGYKVTSVTEFGYRWRSLDGNVNKYRSDLNYKQGFRSFDSNLLLQSEDGKGKYFDSLLITNSGWGADPQGATRVNMERTGFYKFNASFRRVTYFNNLYNFANPVPFPDSEHRQNTDHTFGDFDFTLAPQNEKLRFTLGGSFNDTHGPGGTTERFFSDEFAINSKIKNRSNDFRIGAVGKLFGFNWGLSQGFRTFKDRANYFLDAPSQGNNPTNQARLDEFRRSAPTEGHAYYTQFNTHRTFAKKLDFTARLIYSSTNSRSTLTEFMRGRDNTSPAGILVTSDQIDASTDSKRPQTRGDLGLTYMVTDKFRISNTFSFDQFTVNGGEVFREAWVKANGARSLTDATGYRVSAYKRYLNTIEGDYQVNSAVGFHIGYRYTHRSIDNTGFDRSASCVTTTNPPCPTAQPIRTTTLINESESNATNTLIAGMKIKPAKSWVVFWDVEHGQADNVFTRVENYNFTNFRVRSRLTLNKFVFNVSALSKDNDNPSGPKTPPIGVILPANVDYVTNIKNRFYTGSLDWEPRHDLSFSTGYTYRHLTSYTPIAVPISGAPGTYVYSFSQFFMRDHYAFFDVSAKPMDRVSLFASYRISLDKGQGDRVTAPVVTILTPYIIESYPMQLQSPEFRVAFRITRNIDWNVGYQYYDYKDKDTPLENYRAHLPYTSFRIYFGGGAADR